MRVYHKGIEFCSKKYTLPSSLSTIFSWKWTSQRCKNNPTSSHYLLYHLGFSRSDASGKFQNLNFCYSSHFPKAIFFFLSCYNSLRNSGSVWFPPAFLLLTMGLTEHHRFTEKQSWIFCPWARSAADIQFLTHVLTKCYLVLIQQPFWTVSAFSAHTWLRSLAQSINKTSWVLLQLVEASRRWARGSSSRGMDRCLDRLG